MTYALLVRHATEWMHNTFITAAAAATHEHHTLLAKSHDNV